MTVEFVDLGNRRAAPTIPPWSPLREPLVYCNEIQIGCLYVLLYFNSTFLGISSGMCDSEWAIFASFTLL